jgi:hypothetical protein
MNPKLIKKINAQLDRLELVRLDHDVETWWRIFSFDEVTGEIHKLVEQKNLIPYQGADVLARALAGDDSYAVGAMYFEYENTAGAPTVPSPQRDEDISYYLDTLSLSATKDYIRVPLVIPAGFSSSDSDKYAGNQATFFAITSGSTGTHGKAFSNAANSKVYGVALAATPTPTQYTSDLLFSRSYDGFDPVPKEDGYQIGAQYLIRFR